MAKISRVFLIVLDSFGIGEMPDSSLYGDSGSNTFAAVSSAGKLALPNLRALGLYNINEISEPGALNSPEGCFARMAEASKGKDTTIGHWEIAGIISSKPLPTYPDGFPGDVLRSLRKAWGRGILCNMPYSGTRVIDDYGEQHMNTGDLIVYTSADSVLQIAAHEEIVPLDELYDICEKARDIMCGEHGVGRIIARPFTGSAGSFARTTNRHDYSLPPPSTTMLDILAEKGLETIGVGKIGDIFAGRGISESILTRGNEDGMDKTIALASREFKGLCFVNLVDFDMLYGHRNDITGYAKALTAFDLRLGQLLPLLRPDDVLMITADHGCDPSSPSTDHSREYVPLLVTGARLQKGVNLRTRSSFADIAATIQEMFGAKVETAGKSFLRNILIKETAG